MKTLLLIRHAKSSWDDLSMPDFRRPLNARGRKDAPEMAQRLLQKEQFPDLILSSPANRAITTARMMADVIGYQVVAIREVDELYHASSAQIAAVLRDAGSSDCVWLFAHNPGVTDFVNEYTPVRLDNMPTCGVFAMQFDINDWHDINGAKARFLFFDYPKSDHVS